MKQVLFALALAGILVGGPSAAEQYQKAPDNTGKNVRDRGDATLTPMDQGGSAADREVTANIRKAIVADGSLSTNAHNVKIITAEGVVTLRGPVKTAKEKATVAGMAAKAAGVKRVDNQLEIEAK